ncbi:MAG TPA: hypothetical protein VM534_11180, partial [Thermoanaerobaculia bacterium]|nr:hypothetical protein [Thermoanaerobaculia bacterium]
MTEPFRILRQGKSEEGGFATGFLVSLVIHSSLIGFALFRSEPASPDETAPLRFVELIEQPAASPRTYTEAPGPAI